MLPQPPPKHPIFYFLQLTFSALCIGIYFSHSFLSHKENRTALLKFCITLIFPDKIFFSEECPICIGFYSFQNISECLTSLHLYNNSILYVQKKYSYQASCLSIILFMYHVDSIYCTDGPCSLWFSLNSAIRDREVRKGKNWTLSPLDPYSVL